MEGEAGYLLTASPRKLLWLSCLAPFPRATQIAHRRRGDPGCGGRVFHGPVPSPRFS